VAVGVVWLGALLLGALPGLAQAQGPAPDRVGPGVRAALDAGAPDDWVAVGVTLRADPLPEQVAARRAHIRARQQAVLDGLPRDAFVLRRRYEMLAGLAGWARRTAVDALARRDDVRSVYLDGRVHATLVQGKALIGADDAHGFGVTGAGVTVAILDTGIDTNHPDLQDDLVAEQCYCSDPHPSPVIGAPCCPNGQETQSGPGAAEDDQGHGTSVAGIVTSGGVAAAPGVAPDAGVVAIRVLGPTGSAFSDVDAGLDWVLLNRNAFGDPIRVVNLSLGDGVEHADPASSPCTGSNTADAIAALHAAGVAVFVSSGNDGFDGGIAFPACVPDAISVGGVYDAPLGTVSWCGNSNCTTILCTDTAVADGFVCHTNSDESLDLLAPDYRTRTSAIGGGVQNSFGGTSASSPYAAAQAALLLDADASLTPDQMLAALTASGGPVTNPGNGLSFPRSDVQAALLPLLGDCANGVVEPGEQCDDGNSADGDCCSSSCQFEFIGSPCDDGDACTTVSICDGAAVCVGGVPPDCDDGDVCTAESCDALAGCVSTPIPGCAPTVPQIPAMPGSLVLLMAGGLAATAGAAARSRRSRS
jgi:cysteine-rich repeat protein